MKETTVQFNFDEARKDPSRVRHKNPDHKPPTEVHVFSKRDTLAILWPEYGVAYSYRDDAAAHFLCLTAKTREVPATALYHVRDVGFSVGEVISARVEDGKLFVTIQE